MAKRVTLTFVRPDTDTAWYEITSGETDYIVANYVDTNKRATRSVSGHSGLTLTTIHTYTDDGLVDWLADSTIQTFVTKVRTYYNGLSVSQARVTEDI